MWRDVIKVIKLYLPPFSSYPHLVLGVLPVVIEEDEDTLRPPPTKPAPPIPPRGTVQDEDQDLPPSLPPPLSPDDIPPSLPPPLAPEDIPPSPPPPLAHEDIPLSVPPPPLRAE